MGMKMEAGSMSHLHFRGSFVTKGEDSLNHNLRGRPLRTRSDSPEEKQTAVVEKNT